MIKRILVIFGIIFMIFLISGIILKTEVEDLEEKINETCYIEARDLMLKYEITDKNLIINGEAIAFKSIPMQTVKACYGNGHRGLISDFYDCIENQKHFEIDAYEGAKVIKLTLGIYNSKGKTISI